MQTWKYSSVFNWILTYYTTNIIDTLQWKNVTQIHPRHWAANSWFVVWVTMSSRHKTLTFFFFAFHFNIRFFRAMEKRKLTIHQHHSIMLMMCSTAQTHASHFIITKFNDSFVLSSSPCSCALLFKFIFCVVLFFFPALFYKLAL